VIKFCESGDKRIAVGTGIRPIRWCRQCYVNECGDQFEQWKVVFRALSPAEREDLAIACARTGEDIQAGGTVWLDPVETNIEALVYAGYIEAVEAPKPAAKAAKTEV